MSAQEDGFDHVLRAIAEKRPGADRVLVDRFKGHVRRLLTRMLGPGPDIDDLMQEALFRVFARLSRVHPPEALPGFVTSVTVLVAREALRKRRRARWLSFFASEDLAEIGGRRGSADVPEDVRAFYGALSKVSVHSQLCVTLRYVEGMQLEELAKALDVSLASAKRHLKKAEEEVMALLGEDETGALPWLRGAVR